MLIKNKFIVSFIILFGALSFRLPLPERHSTQLYVGHIPEEGLDKLLEILGVGLVA